MTFTFFLLGYNSYSQTTVPAGNVSGVWTAANSPYHVQGTIVIQDGQNLIIEPGTLIEFHPSADLWVRGQITAIADSLTPIIFTAQNIGSGWRGIIFDSVNIASDSSIFEYCTIEYGTIGGLMRITNFDKVRVENCLLQYGDSFIAGGVRLYNSDAIFKKNTLQYITADYQGGAFYVRWGSPLIQGNEIAFNDGGASGGAVHVFDNGTPNITDNYIHDNNSVNGGAILLGNWCNAVITNNLFENNSAIYDGGALWSGFAAPTISNNIFRNNQADSEGGALFFWDSSVPNLFGNTYEGNEARYAGAVMVSENSIATLENETFINNHTWLTNGGSCGALKINGGAIAKVVNCEFSNNYTNGFGGAVTVDGDNSTFYNCIFTNNRATNGGALDYSGNGIPFTNCTFANNHVANIGGGLYINTPDSITFNNCIFWGNTADSQGPSLSFGSNTSGNVNFINCNIEGGISSLVLNSHILNTDLNNINTNPLFANPSVGTGELFDGINANWQLIGSSPCYNAGTTDTTGLNLPLTDLIGNIRIIGDTIDQGVYEATIATEILSSSNGTQHICEGIPHFLFTSASWVGTINYQWQKDNVDLIGETNDTLFLSGSFLEVGSYRCIISNSNGSDTTNQIPVVIHSSPILTSLGPDITFCADLTTTLTAMNGVFNYNWNDGLSTNDTIVISTTGNFFYSVEDTNGCFAYSDTVFITVNPLPIFEIPLVNYQCGTDTFWIVSPISGVSFDWNNGESIIDSIGVNTQQWHTLTVTDSIGCTYSDSMFLNIMTIPSINLPADDTLCFGTVITLDAYAGPSTHTFDWNNGLFDTQTIDVDTTGQYSVIVTNGSQCSTYDTVNLVFNPIPIVDLGPDQFTCSGDSILLSVATGYSNYNWNNGLSSNYENYVQSTGLYIVQVTDSNECLGSDTTSITIYSNPIISMQPDETICIYNGSISLNASPVGGTFTGVGVNNSTFDPVISDTGLHYVSYMYTDGFGCSAIDSFLIFVDQCLGINEINDSNLIISPNPANEILYIQNKNNGTIHFYDNIGRLVYTEILYEKNKQLDISNLNSGVYQIIFVTDSGYLFKATFIKQ